MTQPKNPTGFDAFFDSITNSPEFRDFSKSKNDISSLADLEKSLLEMQSDVEKATNLMKDFDTKLSSDLPVDTGGQNDFVSQKNNAPLTGTGSTTPPKTGNPQDDSTPSAIEVQRFVRKDGKPWGFEAVAGMEGLKEELRNSFIKPLRFKFMVEKLRKENNSSVTTIEGGQSSNNTDTTGSLRTSRGQAQEGQKPDKMALLERLYSEYEKFKISIPTGMLFYGPPGTGKTFITKKLAEELECGFVSKNLGEFGSSYLHQTTKNIKDFFDAAKKAAESEPIILFLDEIDSLISARTERVDANKAEEISQFLQEFNALETAPNLIVIAATNRPDHLDPAILRSGRLDKKVYLGPPDETARTELFRMYIEKAGRPHKKLDYEELARLADGYVSADIEAMCDEVARDASRDLLDLIDEAESGTLTEKHLDGHAITMSDLKKTISETPSSLKMVDMSVYESWLEKIK